MTGFFCPLLLRRLPGGREGQNVQRLDVPELQRKDPPRSPLEDKQPKVRTEEYLEHRTLRSTTTNPYYNVSHGQWRSAQSPKCSFQSLAWPAPFTCPSTYFSPIKNPYSFPYSFETPLHLLNYLLAFTLFTLFSSMPPLLSAFK